MPGVPCLWFCLNMSIECACGGEDLVGLTYVKPRCYKDEDMVGRCKRIYNKCHASGAPRSALLRYTIMVGLRWWLEMGRLLERQTVS